MNVIFALVKRNLKVFLRNRTAVFFSFLSIIIIIGLYALFLGEVQVDNIKNLMNPPAGITIIDKDIAWLVNSWIMAGLISVNTVTTTLGTYGIIVTDIEYKKNNDFLSSPIKRYQIVLGYIISSWILTFVLSVLGFFMVEFYIVMQGGEMLSFIEIIQTLLIITLSVISFSAILFYITSFIKTSNAFGTFSSIVGTLIGFLAGIYVPPGALPNFAKTIISLFPVSYSASMLRRIFTDKPINNVFGQANSIATNKYQEAWGIKLFIGDTELGWMFMIISLIIIGFVFYGLSVIRITRNKLS
ncbi:ABC transporter permease [Mycoplasmatota bacterium]|nr:ABC transporter permease [Mycoplasmatota bacterium]